MRQNVAHVILRTLIEMAKKQAADTGGILSGDVQLSFTSDDLSAAIRSDITLSGEVKKVLPAIDRALMFLHEQKIITLQGGLAILRQAMTLRLAPAASGRYYNKGDFKPLAVHYRERRLQVHVMMRYAALALEKLAHALTLVLEASFPVVNRQGLEIAFVVVSSAGRWGQTKRHGLPEDGQPAL